MPKTVEQLNKEIARLQKQVEAVKAREVQDVIERIKEAIEYYGLTPAQLFKSSSAKSKRTAKPSSSADGEAPAAKVRKPKAASSKLKKRPTLEAAQPASEKAPVVAKFADQNGNTWTGRGRPPRWFAEAIAGGKTKEELIAAG